MTIYGYARVSTDGQSVDDQVQQLTAAGAVSVFQESVSGKSRFKFGPKPKLNELQIADAARRRDAGESLRSVAKLYRVNHATLSSRLPKADEPPPRRLIDPATAQAARAFLRHLKGKYAPVDMLIYGSRARGDHTPASDADLAVILKGRPGDRAGIGLDMAGIAVDVLDETGILVSPLPLWSVELKRPELSSNPALIENIRREGLRL